MNYNYKYKAFSKDSFAQIAFVNFQTEKLKNEFLALYPQTFIETFNAYLTYFFTNVLCSCCSSENTKKLNQNRITFYVEQASQPDDIIWENLEYSVYEQNCRKIVTYLSTLILLSIGFFIIFGLNLAQVK